MGKPLKFKDFVSVDYTQSGDDQLAYNAKKRKKDIPTGNTGEEVENEALNMQQRRAVSKRMKSSAMKAKIKLGRKKAERKLANMEVLKKRARKAARGILLKKLTKDIPKSELSFSRRQELEKKLDKMKGAVERIAKKQLPKIRQAELKRKRGGSDKS
jgi:hypothetical protein